MSLILTENLQTSHRVKNAVDKHTHELLSYIESEESQNIYLGDQDAPASDVAARMGSPMHFATLEKRLRPLLPSSCVFVDHFNRPYKGIFDTRRGLTVCVYERAVMPERSIMSVVERELPDKDFISRRQTMQRADLPQWEYKGGEIVFDPTAARPGFKRFKQNWREATRGWRTVLLRLLQEGYLTLAQVERNFGAANNVAWAGHTGKAGVN